MVLGPLAGWLPEDEIIVFVHVNDFFLKLEVGAGTGALEYCVADLEVVFAGWVGERVRRFDGTRGRVFGWTRWSDSKVYGFFLENAAGVV